MKRLNVFLLLLFLLGGCTAIRVKNIDAVNGFALTNYKTFGFYEVVANGDVISPQYSQQLGLLKAAIQEELLARGLSPAPTDPDLLVNIGVVTAERVETRQTNFQTDAPRYIGQRRYTWKSEEIEVGRYREGTVTVHLVDRKQNTLVWKGAVTAVIPRKEVKLAQTIRAGIGKLFQRIGPG